MSKFDVWIIRFTPGESSPAERLQTAFGIAPASARALEQSLPKVVKHGVSPKAAGEMRHALESIGAVVECRPAREVRIAAGPTGADRGAVFHPPEEELFSAGRISAIDPFAPASATKLPRISVDDAIPPIAATPSEPRAEEGGDSQGTSTSSPAMAREQGTRTYVCRATRTMAAGVTILAIGWFVGNSILRGEANWIGIGFDGFGIYFLGLGAHDLVTSLRS